MARMQAIADKLPKAQGLLMGDHGYKKMCINDAVRKISTFFEGTEGKPPKRQTIETWFYKDNFPSWAIAVLSK
jgi:hypothetical protein